jgi:hypothetical protein
MCCLRPAIRPARSPFRSPGHTPSSANGLRDRGPARSIRRSSANPQGQKAASRCAYSPVFSRITAAAGERLAWSPAVADVDELQMGDPLKVFSLQVKSRTPWIRTMPAIRLSAMPIVCPAPSRSRRMAAARSSGRTGSAASSRRMASPRFPCRPH